MRSSVLSFFALRLILTFLWWGWVILFGYTILAMAVNYWAGNPVPPPSVNGYISDFDTESIEVTTRDGYPVIVGYSDPVGVILYPSRESNWTPRWYYLWAWVEIGVRLGYIGGILAVLRRILSNFGKGVVLEEENSNLIRLIGVLTIAAVLIQKLYMAGSNFIASQTLEVNEGAKLITRFHLDTMSVWALVMGLVFIVLAEVLRLGAALHKERSLIV